MKNVLLLISVIPLITVPGYMQSTIRKVDFKNFTYKLSCGTADVASRVTVRDGAYSGAKRGVDVYLNVYDVKFGDLNGDSRDEAVVLYSCGSGASYVYFRGLVFTLRNRKPVLLTELEGGNKGDGGFHDVAFAKRVLLVQRYQLATAGSPCCPELIETTKYKWNGKRLIPIGKPRLRKIPINNT